jgi:hypothetical protein
MRPLLPVALATLVASLLTTMGCGGSEAPPREAPPLPPAEVFTWGAQPISFSPPPEGWRREKEQSGGLRGARFVLSGSVGERIHVAEHYALDDRDRCARLAALAADHESLDDHDFRNDLLRARPHAPEPINGWEARYAADANASLDSAFEARMQGDAAMTQYWLDRAREEARQIRYTLDEVVDRVTFTPGRSPAGPTFKVGERVPATVAGEPGYELNYVMKLRGRTYLGREYYVLKNNRLFVASFQGLAANVSLFEEIVESITFPVGACDHER